MDGLKDDFDLQIGGSKLIVHVDRRDRTENKPEFVFTIICGDEDPDTFTLRWEDESDNNIEQLMHQNGTNVNRKLAIEEFKKRYSGF